MSRGRSEEHRTRPRCQEAVQSSGNGLENGVQSKNKDAFEEIGPIRQQHSEAGVFSASDKVKLQTIKGYRKNFTRATTTNL